MYIKYVLLIFILFIIILDLCILNFCLSGGICFKFVDLLFFGCVCFEKFMGFLCEIGKYIYMYFLKIF